MDVPGGVIDLVAAEALLAGIFRLTRRGGRLDGRDVYVSRSWRDAEADLPDRVCRQLHAAGFRLIGDAKDQAGFVGGHRVESIVESCGVSRGPRRKPPFLFRDLQVWHYTDDAELLATVHKIVRPYRRRVLSDELPARP